MAINSVIRHGAKHSTEVGVNPHDDSVGLVDELRHRDVKELDQCHETSKMAELRSVPLLRFCLNEILCSQLFKTR